MSRARGTDVSFTRMAGSAKPRQEKVRGPINRNCDYHEIGDHIEPARDRMLFVPFPPALGQGTWIFVEQLTDLPWRAKS